MRKYIIMLVIAILVVIGLGASVAASASATTGEPGTSPENPIVINSLDALPEGAVITGEELDNCSTVTTATLTTPATDEVSHQVWAYEKTVLEYTTKYQYEKQVRGVVQQRDEGSNDEWHNTGRFFNWTAVSDDILWSEENVEILESGTGSIVVEEWTQGKHEWRQLGTEYQYVNTGITEQVETGSSKEMSGEVLVEMNAPWVILAGYPKTIVDEDGTPETVTYYLHDDGVQCEDEEEPKKPEMIVPSYGISVECPESGPFLNITASSNNEDYTADAYIYKGGPSVHVWLHIKDGVNKVFAPTEGYYLDETGTIATAWERYPRVKCVRNDPKNPDAPNSSVVHEAPKSSESNTIKSGSPKAPVANPTVEVASVPTVVAAGVGYESAPSSEEWPLAFLLLGGLMICGGFVLRKAL